VAGEGAEVVVGVDRVNPWSTVERDAGARARLRRSLYRARVRRGAERRQRPCHQWR
jgi:hypothetical protein